MAIGAVRTAASRRHHSIDVDPVAVLVVANDAEATKAPGRSKREAALEPEI